MRLLLAILPLVLTALGLAASLVLFLSVKREMRAQARRNRAQLDGVLEQLKQSEPPAAEGTPPPPPPRSGMNLSKRVQALRLHRRGEDIGHIAAALGVPRGEVELLIRVQQISARRAAAVGPV